MTRIVTDKGATHSLPDATAYKGLDNEACAIAMATKVVVLNIEAERMGITTRYNTADDAA